MSVTEQRVDSQKLQADAKIDLFEIQLYPSGSLYVCRDFTTTWQGHTYQFWGVDLTGVGSSSDDSTSRPKFSVANYSYDSEGEPINGVFSALNAQNMLEGGTVIRRRVLKAHLDTNTNIKEEVRFKISKISSLRRDIITLELRNTLDGPRFTIPARKFLPPDFPQVKMY